MYQAVKRDFSTFVDWLYVIINRVSLFPPGFVLSKN